MNYTLNYSDEDYREAKNYDGTNFYNYPMTVSMESGKYILPFGTSDSLHTDDTAEYLTVIAENRGLDYISLINIDNIDGEVTQSIYLNSCSDDELTEGIFDLGMNEQFEILSNWFI